MQFYDKSDDNNLAVQKTVLLLLAVSLNVLELCIPRIPFFPWLKPGIANCITIIWIIRFGTVDALLYTFLRVWLSSFYIGFSLVTMGLALSGGLLSTLVMSALCIPLRSQSKIIGTVGIAVTGALFHNIGQLGAVYVLLVKNDILFYQLPFMIVASVTFGSITGILVPFFWKVVSRIFTIDTLLSMRGLKKIPKPSFWKMAGIITFLMSAVALLLITSLKISLIIAAIVTIVVFFIIGRKFYSIVYPLRFWFLFIIIAFVYLVFSYGTLIPGFTMLTYDGVKDASLQSLRLWIWIQTSLLLHHWQVNYLVYHFLKKLFPHHGSSLSAGVFAMDYFPEILRFAQSNLSRKGLLWRRPVQSAIIFVERTCMFVLELIGREEDQKS